MTVDAGNVIPPLTRTCKKCQVKKPLNEFVKHKQCKYGRTYRCCACDIKIRRHEWARDIEKRCKRENELNRQRKKITVEWFGGKCQDCNGVFPDCVYDFHHLDPSQKTKKISLFRTRLANLLTDLDFIAELEKCVMLCSNCHRIRHWDISDRTERKDRMG